MKMKEERQMMKKIAGGFGSLVIALFLCGKASAYCHANAFGGGTAHTYGHTYHSNAYGGSTSHTYGEGTSHTNAYGGTTTGAYGAGAVHTTPYGTTSYASAYHPSTAYYGYHPPTTVGYYQSGCYNCGYGSSAGAAAVGAVAGMAVGAAVASANTSAAAANANAAAANANAAAANANAVAAGGYTSTSYAMGAVYGALPTGCASPSMLGTAYYVCGNTWFLPSYGANGVYYRVVPAP